MDIDYSCGHSRKSFTGDIVPTNCPDCGKGEMVGVRGVFAFSEKLDAKPLTGKEPLTDEKLQHDPVFAHYTCGCVLDTEPGGIVPKECERCSKGGMYSHTLKTIEPQTPTIRLNTEPQPRELSMRVECPDHGLTIGQTFCSGCREEPAAHEKGQEPGRIAPEWDGEDLPPIGCECECMRHGLWVKCEVRAHGEDHGCPVAFAQTEFDSQVLDERMFRPLRTTEQQEREELLSMALSIFEQNGLLGLYDAGMLRKAGDQ